MAAEIVDDTAVSRKSCNGFNMDFLNWNRLLSSSRVFYLKRTRVNNLLPTSLEEVESCKPALVVYSCPLGRQQSMNDSVGTMAKQSL